MSALLSLIYTSHAVDSMSREDILNLLDECERNNARHGISGLLLYDGKRTFIQVLEGDVDSVERLYEHIKKDPRHTRITNLGRREIHGREFPDWKMGFRNLNDIDTSGIDAYSDFMEHENDLAYLATNPGFALELLHFFKANTH